MSGDFRARGGEPRRRCAGVLATEGAHLAGGCYSAWARRNKTTLKSARDDKCTLSPNQ